jgi:hypothetical protein
LQIPRLVAICREVFVFSLLPIGRLGVDETSWLRKARTNWIPINTGNALNMTVPEVVTTLLLADKYQ